VAPQALTEREEQTLRRRVLRGVGRLLENVERLEVNPHRVWRVRQASALEGVCREQVAELVVKPGNGNADGGDRGGQREAHESDENDRQFPLPTQMAPHAGHPAHPFRARFRSRMAHALPRGVNQES
jgi:hypothetical protein